MLKIYLARAMSGRIMADVVREAVEDRQFLREYNDGKAFLPLDPVQEEGVRPKKKKLQASYKDMVSFWKRDKELIRQANVIFDMTPGMKSEGVAHETAYARYFLWKPVVRVYKDGSLPPRGSVAFFEDDVLAPSLFQACVVADTRWGTWQKRFLWRAKLLWRCLPKAFLYQIQEWK